MMMSPELDEADTRALIMSRIKRDLHERHQNCLMPRLLGAVADLVADDTKAHHASVRDLVAEQGPQPRAH